MTQFLPRTIASLPWSLIVLLVCIAGFGCVILYSAAGGAMLPWSARHAMRFAILLAMAIAISRLPERIWSSLSYPGYIAIATMLLLVELYGAIRGGSQRWLDLGFIRLQPSEFMKVAVVLAVANFYARLPSGMIRSWTALWPAMVLIGIPAVLVILQPDLGTALAIIAGGVTVAFLAGLPMRLFVGTGLALAFAFPILFSMLHDYQRRRILIFLDPESDPLGAGYHISQSKIAIGSGGIFGKGFLNGSQSHLDYLPEGHTDFVFATMVEEWGMIGGLAVLFGFFLLLRWGTRVAARASTKFGRLTAAGLTMTIFFYIAINLMMVMGMAPVVGIPLPFLSYGGSSMLTIMICIGIIMSIERHSRPGDGSFA